MQLYSQIYVAVYLRAVKLVNSYWSLYVSDFQKKVVTFVLQEECVQIVNAFLRFFHGGEGELALDSSLLTVRVADKRKPKPASDGIHRNKT